MSHINNAGPNNKVHLHLKDVPEEFSFIVLIAKQYAGTNEELQQIPLSGKLCAVMVVNFDRNIQRRIVKRLNFC